MLSELSSEDGRKYFRRFVRRWNDGALPRKCYESNSGPTSEAGGSRPPPPPHAMPPFPPSGPSTTAPPRPEEESSDDEIGPRPPSPAGPSFPVHPTHSDIRFAKEAAAEQAALERKFERKAARREAYDRAEEIAPKMGGKEGRIAEKKAANAANKEMREKDTDAVVDEATLLGDGGGFAAA